MLEALLLAKTGADRVSECRDCIRDLEHSVVDLLQGIDSLLELDVVRRELGLLHLRSTLRFLARQPWSRSHLIVGLAKLLLDILLRPGRKGREGGTASAVSAYLELCTPTGSA